MDFTKKINIGLTLDTNIRKYESFLKKNSKYIHSVYFSPPLGRNYHTRRIIIAHQLFQPHKKKLLWNMLELTASYGVETELCLNTMRLDEGMVEKAAEALLKHGINVPSVCFVREYYDYVKKYFPDKKYIWSFNNGFRTEKEIAAASEKYKDVNTVVLGANFLRNNGLYQRLHGQGKDIYLLINNGCSYNCETCHSSTQSCTATFKKNLERHPVEYWYALQSVFPCELHDGIIDTQNICCFKISNRSSNLDYAQRALDSYINNSVLEFIKKDRKNYALWGRVGYFWRYFSSMDFNKVVEYKQQILGTELNIR